jgi:hypothetical protein
MFDVLGIDVLELRRIDDGNVINCGGVIDCGSALIDVLELEWRGIHGGGDGGGELDGSGSQEQTRNAERRVQARRERSMRGSCKSATQAPGRTTPSWAMRHTTAVTSLNWPPLLRASFPCQMNGCHVDHDIHVPLVQRLGELVEGRVILQPKRAVRRARVHGKEPLGELLHLGGGAVDAHVHLV